MRTELPKQPGVYLIECTGNDKFYIGSGANMRNRQTHHLHSLRKDQHHNPKLQHAFNKYGENSIEFYVVELVDSARLYVEQYWVRALDAVKRGFNCAAHVEKTTLGRKATLAERKAMSKRRQGVPIHSEEYKSELSRKVSGFGNPRFGKPGTLLGKIFTVEHRKRLSKSAKKLYPTRKKIKVEGGGLQFA